MSGVHEQLSAQFSAFERRGRGWQVFDWPVSPEPPFVRFTGYSALPVIDDGRVPTVGSSLIAGLNRWLKPTPITPHLEAPPEESLPSPLPRGELIELKATLPPNLKIPSEAFSGFLSNLSFCTEPLAFELIADSEQIATQFAIPATEAAIVRRQLSAYFPELVFQPAKGTLDAFADPESHQCVVEFGSGKEFLLPLASGGIDPFVGIVGVLSDLRSDESALYQILFQPCQHPWKESILRSVTGMSPIYCTYDCSA